jgi:hypothetical protein
MSSITSTMGSYWNSVTSSLYSTGTGDATATAETASTTTSATATTESGATTTALSSLSSKLSSNTGLSLLSSQESSGTSATTYSYFDTDGDGSLSSGELKGAASVLASKLDNENLSFLTSVINGDSTDNASVTASTTSESSAMLKSIETMYHKYKTAASTGNSAETASSASTQSVTVSA